LKGSTLNRFHSLLSSIFRYAVRQGVMRSNPMAQGTVPRAKESGIRVRYLSGDEEKRLREVIRVDCPGKELELELAILTGMRRSEQFGAK
jgi:site-specific recombinase XerD